MDSHTEGEPTRAIIDGGPDLGGGPLSERLELLRARHDWLRAAAVNEPRGSEVLVGALLLRPGRPECQVGVIFFNATGYLGMCGHGTMGVVRTLAHLGRLRPGPLLVDTPVGPVEAALLPDGQVTVVNVPSYRDREVTLEWRGAPLRAELAWGGNWFLRLERSDLAARQPVPPLTALHARELTELCRELLLAARAGEGSRADHVELCEARPEGPGLRTFTWCPSGAWDRSPCGTGTSATMACLAAQGRLAEGEEHLQESPIGSTFRGRFRWLDRTAGRIRPEVTGRAFVTGEGTLLLDPADPYRHGIPETGLRGA